MLEIGLIGCGAIGSTVVEATLSGQIPDTHLLAILSRSSNSAIRHAQKASKTHFVAGIEEMVALPKRALPVPSRPTLRR